MKRMLLMLAGVILATTLRAQSQTVILQDTINIPPNTLRAIAYVVSADDQMVVLKIEQVTGYGKDVNTIFNKDDMISAQMPGKNKPEVNAKVMVDLKEKLNVGAITSSYILLTFKTVD